MLHTLYSKGWRWEYQLGENSNNNNMMNRSTRWSSMTTDYRLLRPTGPRNVGRDPRIVNLLSLPTIITMTYNIGNVVVISIIGSNSPHRKQNDAQCLGSSFQHFRRFVLIIFCIVTTVSCLYQLHRKIPIVMSRTTEWNSNEISYFVRLRRRES